VGSIDEVAIHNGALSDQDIERHATRHYAGSGELTSVLLSLPEGKQWDHFEAEASAPAGTCLEFDLLDAEGKVLVPNLRPGASLAAASSGAIRLRARMLSAHGGQTPVLRSWEVTWR